MKNTAIVSIIALLSAAVLTLSLILVFSKAPSPAEPEYDIVYRYGDTYNEDHVTPELLADKPAIPDEETAIKVASAIFEGLDLPPDENGWGYEPSSVLYDETDQVWSVLFSLDAPEELIVLGGGYSIRLAKSDGRVLNIEIQE